MVERFLQWRLPENFNPDGGISFKKMFNENTPHPMKYEPVGTNLFDYTQAKEMIRYLLEGLPDATESSQRSYDQGFTEGRRTGNIQLAEQVAQLRQERDADRLAEQIYALAEKVIISEEPLHFVRKDPLPSQIAAVIRGEVKDGKR